MYARRMDSEEKKKNERMWERDNFGPSSDLSTPFLGQFSLFRYDSPWIGFLYLRSGNISIFVLVPG